MRAVQKDVVFVISSGTLLVAAYDRKKYLWKLMYTKMLGYDIEFGHKQAMDLMASSRLVFTGTRVPSYPSRGIANIMLPAVIL